MQFFPLITQQSENVDKILSPRFQGRNQGEKVAQYGKATSQEPRSPGAPGFPTPGLLLWTTEVSHKKLLDLNGVLNTEGHIKMETVTHWHWRALKCSISAKLPGNASAADPVLDCA